MKFAFKQRKAYFLKEKRKSNPFSKDLSSWTATGQALDSWTATGHDQIGTSWQILYILGLGSGTYFLAYFHKDSASFCLEKHKKT